MRRRLFLKTTLTGCLMTTALAAGLLKPVRALAAAWPGKAFAQNKIDQALVDLYGTSTVAQSSAIKIKAPLQAENGAVVPISVSTTLPDAKSISVFVVENVQPLVSSVGLPKASGYFSARIKMAKTSQVQVVIKSGNKLFTASTTIKVTVGGCGG